MVNKLSDVCEIITGFPFKSENFNIDAKGIRLVRGMNVSSSGLRWDNQTRWWNDFTDKRIEKYKLFENAIVLAMDGNVGDNKALIDKDDLPLLLVQRVACLKATKCDQLFLWYVVNTREFTGYIKNIKTGTTISHISAKQIGDFEFNFPDIITQKKIASFLFAIDTKIKINKKISDNLVNQALCNFSLLYSGKQKNGKIGDYCAIKSGFAFKSSWWVNEGVKVIKIGDISQDNLCLDACSFVSVENAKKANQFLLNAGDIVIAMTGATIGKFSIVPDSPINLYANQRVGKFFLGDNPIEKLPFLYCTLKQPDVYGEIINKGQGSAQPNFSGADVMNVQCVIPSKEIIDNFNLFNAPLFRKILLNYSENSKLRELRDTLLPKFLNGEIDVSKVEDVL